MGLGYPVDEVRNMVDGVQPDDMRSRGVGPNIDPVRNKRSFKADKLEPVIRPCLPSSQASGSSG